MSLVNFVEYLQSPEFETPLVNVPRSEIVEDVVELFRKFKPNATEFRNGWTNKTGEIQFLMAVSDTLPDPVQIRSMRIENGTLFLVYQGYTEPYYETQQVQEAGAVFGFVTKKVKVLVPAQPILRKTRATIDKTTLDSIHGTMYVSEGQGSVRRFTLQWFVLAPFLRAFLKQNTALLIRNDLSFRPESIRARIQTVADQLVLEGFPPEKALDEATNMFSFDMGGKHSIHPKKRSKKRSTSKKNF